MSAISIAMATYNGEKYLEDQLASIARQTVTPDELIISDDGSTDRTLEIAKGFAKTVSFETMITQNPQRLGYALNFARALAACRGDIIFLSDQDDVWLPDKNAAVMKIFQAQKETQVIQCDMILTDAALKPTKSTQLGNIVAAGNNADLFMTGCGTALRRSWLHVAMPFIPDLCAHDNWISRLAIALDARTLLTQPLQYYRRHDANASNWALSAPTSSRTLQLLAQEGFKDVNAGWRREAERMEATLQRIQERSQEITKLGLGDRVEAAVNRQRAAIRNIEKRIEITRRSRLARPPLVAAQLIDGGYRQFSGWRSALKDLVRP
jgi:glycosyltransferase involved in cell wall biosynthesis